jgi:hypothetical protein
MVQYFGKAGINWHETVAYFKDENDNLVTETITHLADGCVQEAHTVAMILDHSLRELKKRYKYLKQAIVQSDNAGCYHSFEMMIPAVAASSEGKQGIPISRFIFSEAQDGKNACDRCIATKKGHIRNAIHAKGEVLFAKDIKGLLGEVRLRQVLLVLLSSFRMCYVFRAPDQYAKIVNRPADLKISRYSDFKVNYKGSKPSSIMMQEQSGYGPSRMIDINLGRECEDNASIWIDAENYQLILRRKLLFDDDSLLPVLTKHQIKKRAIADSSNENDRQDAEERELMYHCGYPNCRKICTRERDKLTCNHAVRRPSLLQMVVKAMHEVFTHINQITEERSLLNDFDCDFLTNYLEHFEPKLNMGNCLKLPGSRNVFSDAAKTFLRNLFENGLNDDFSINRYCIACTLV